MAADTWHLMGGSCEHHWAARGWVCPELWNPSPSPSQSDDDSGGFDPANLLERLEQIFAAEEARVQHREQAVDDTAMHQADRCTICMENNEAQPVIHPDLTAQPEPGQYTSPAQTACRLVLRPRLIRMPSAMNVSWTDVSLVIPCDARVAVEICNGYLKICGQLHSCPSSSSSSCPGHSYQNTATKICSQPPQDTKMRGAQRLHLTHHPGPQKEFHRRPQPEAHPNAKNPPRRRQPTHIHSQMQKYLQLQKLQKYTNMSQTIWANSLPQTSEPPELLWSHPFHSCIPSAAPECLVKCWGAKFPSSEGQGGKSLNLNAKLPKRCYVQECVPSNSAIFFAK